MVAIKFRVIGRGLGARMVDLFETREEAWREVKRLKANRAYAHIEVHNLETGAAWETRRLTTDSDVFC